MVIYDDPHKVAALFLDTPFNPNPRSPKDPFDFGDPATVRMALKRVKNGERMINRPDGYGVYLGMHSNRFYVAVVDLHGKWIGYEEFPTLERLKAAWQLD